MEIGIIYPIEIPYFVRTPLGTRQNWLEVCVKVTCGVEKGEARTYDHPGCPDSLIDIETNWDSELEIISLKCALISDLEAGLVNDKGLIEERLWEEVEKIRES